MASRPSVKQVLDLFSLYPHAIANSRSRVAIARFGPNRAKVLCHGNPGSVFALNFNSLATGTRPRSRANRARLSSRSSRVQEHGIVQPVGATKCSRDGVTSQSHFFSA